LVAEGKPVTSVFSQIVKGVVVYKPQWALGSIVDGLEGNWNLGEKFVWRVGSIEGIDASTKDFALAKIGGRKDANRHHRIAKVFGSS
jgi:hypothetical protein